MREGYALTPNLNGVRAQAQFSRPPPQRHGARARTPAEAFGKIFSCLRPYFLFRIVCVPPCSHFRELRSAVLGAGVHCYTAVLPYQTPSPVLCALSLAVLRSRGREGIPVRSLVGSLFVGYAVARGHEVESLRTLSICGRRGMITVHFGRAEIPPRSLEKEKGANFSRPLHCLFRRHHVPDTMQPPVVASALYRRARVCLLSCLAQ